MLPQDYSLCHASTISAFPIKNWNEQSRLRGNSKTSQKNLSDPVAPSFNTRVENTVYHNDMDLFYQRRNEQIQV